MTEESKQTLLFRDAATGQLTRRGLLHRAALLGLSAPAVAVLLAACGDSTSSATTGTGGIGGTTSMGGSAASPAATTATGATTSTATKAASPATSGDATPSSSPAGSAAASNWKPRDLKVSLTGSGASFPDPIYQLWIQQYKSVASGVTFNYQSVGSGQGKKDFAGGVTDVGASDAPMTDDEMAKTPDTLHIPTVLGSVTVTYNLAGLDKLQFSGPTLAGIFLGKIKTWNDAAIAADNPGVKLPGDAITVVHRSDGSGTTDIFTNYLSKVSPDWKSHVGSGTAVQWPVGIGGEKNPGVTAAVKQTPGAIGYIELVYALENKLPAPAIKNAQGNFVVPTLESTTEAASGFLTQLPDDLRISITNPPDGKNAYPIAGFTWLLVHANMTDVNKAQALTDFIYWALTQGDKFALGLNYAPLPDVLKKKAIAKLEMVKAGGNQAFKAPS